MTFNLIIFWQISIILFFDLAKDFNINYGIYWCIIVPIFFILDIIKEVITGYYFKGKVILEHEKVLLNYFKTGVFLIDIIGLLPFLYINLIRSHLENNSYFS